jgi:hypothetical protein
MLAGIWEVSYKSAPVKLAANLEHTAKTMVSPARVIVQTKLASGVWAPVLLQSVHGR